MLRKSLLAALGLAAAATLPARAETVTVNTPIAAASLHEGPLDMVAYYVETSPEAYEVTATFAPRGENAAPMRVVLALRDGDSATFAMPGYRGANYGFSRTGGAVSISVDAPDQTASTF